VFPVTQKQYELVVGSNPSYFNAGENYGKRPVEYVSWNDITATGTGFLALVSAKSGLDFRLPTEAQWEYACRAGTTTALNSGVNLTSTFSDAAIDSVGRYWHNGGSYDSGNLSSDITGNVGTAFVGTYEPNAWGLYDFHGNVWERCADWYGSYGTAAVEDPEGPDSGSLRVLRGGSWTYYASDCRSAFRFRDTPGYRNYGYGFRVVCSLPTISVHTHTADTAHWFSDAEQHWHVCIADDGAILDAAMHSFGEWVIDTAPTSTATGTSHRNCAVCGYSSVVTIPATGGNENDDGDGGDTPTPPPTGEPTDAERVASAKALLMWDIISDEEQTGVTANLYLPAGDSDTGATIVWMSSSPMVIDHATGAVSRPAFGAENVIITLTATITVGGASDKKYFLVTVLAEDEDDGVPDDGCPDDDVPDEGVPDEGVPDDDNPDDSASGGENDVFAPNVVISDATYAAGSSALERVFATIRGETIPAAGTEIVAGRSVTLTVVDAGANVSYQWRKNGVDVGTDAPTYTEPNIQPGDTFVVVITKHSGTGEIIAQVEKDVPEFVVLGAPRILNSDAKPAVERNSDGSVTLSVDVAGTGRIYYQWYRWNKWAKTDGDWQLVEGALEGALTLKSAADTGRYRVMLTDRTRIRVESAEVLVDAILSNDE
jgi:hypothetical protein